MGTVNVLDIAFKRDFVEAIIVVTTDKVYRNDNSGQAFVETDPLEGKDPYSASKVGTESVVSAWQQIAKISGGPTLIAVRTGNVIGGGDFADSRLIPDLIRGVITGKPIEIRNSESTRPWQHVLDPLYGYLLALNEMTIGEPIKNLNFGPRFASLTVGEVLEIALKSFPEIKSLLRVENGVESQKESLRLDLDSTQAYQCINWNPVFTQSIAIEETLFWWQEHLILGNSAAALCKEHVVHYVNRFH
jgi:CDP-glucose 4,6-dehydratase